MFCCDISVSAIESDRPKTKHTENPLSVSLLHCGVGLAFIAPSVLSNAIHDSRNRNAIRCHRANVNTTAA